MKHTKKLVSLLLTLVMVLSMSVNVFAAEKNSDEKGSITIENAVDGQTYSIYRLMDLESYSKDKAYSYKATEKWEKWLKTQTTYVSFDAQGYVSWVGDADAAAFAKAALAYAKENEIDPDAPEQTKTESGIVKFENLALGYYLVDSSLGILCSLDTTDNAVTMREKNEVPTVDKKVKEGDSWGSANTAKIGDTVKFMTTIHAKKGAQNYVLHDQMTEGLTLDPESIKVQVGESTLKKGEDYTVLTGNDVPEIKDSCTFEIKFTQAYLDTITKDTDIVVTYSAVLNEKAVIADETNNNKTKLDYGDNSSTEWSETTTKTFQFDIVKTDSNDKLLNGAEFELYTSKTGGEKIALVKEADGIYRVATVKESGTEGFTSAVIEAGKVTVKGLDAAIYWLEETKAPAGYNKLPGRVEVNLIDENDPTDGKNLTATMKMNGDVWEWEEGGVRIVNNTGTELPSTGGIGTTIFYAAGSVLVLAAVVLLVAKKRMNAEVRNEEN